MQSWTRAREVEKVKPSPQISIAQLPEDQQDAAMAAADYAREHFPSVPVGHGSLHVCNYDGDWQIWLNCEDSEFTGLCLASCVSKQAALTEATATLEAALDALQSDRYR